MELTIVAFLVLAFVVVDTISDIAGLLDLGDKRAFTDGVNTTGRNKEAVVGMNLILLQGIDDRPVVHHPGVFLGSDGFFQSHAQRSARIRLQGVPHLCLAHGLSLPVCRLVIRMNLNGEILSGVDKLHEQRKCVSEAFVVFVSYHFFFHLGDDIVEVPALVFAFCHYRFIVFYARYFPAFPDVGLLVVDLLERYDFVSTPNS